MKRAPKSLPRETHAFAIEVTVEKSPFRPSTFFMAKAFFLVPGGRGRVESVHTYGPTEARARKAVLHLALSMLAGVFKGKP